MSKYHNEKTTVGKYTFDSKKEAERFIELRDMLNKREIEYLAVQVPFELQPAFTSKSGTHYRKIEYIADFVYQRRGEWVVEDVKGFRTPVYKIKKKLFAYKYRGDGLEIAEI